MIHRVCGTRKRRYQRDILRCRRHISARLRAGLSMGPGGCVCVCGCVCAKATKSSNSFRLAISFFLFCFLHLNDATRPLAAFLVPALIYPHFSSSFSSYSSFTLFLFPSTPAPVFLEYSSEQGPLLLAIFLVPTRAIKLT